MVSKEQMFERIKSTDFQLECRGMFYFSKGRHEEQVREGSGYPYFVHPKGVAFFVMKFGGTSDQINAALAHDLLEDTFTSFEEIAVVSGSYNCAKICSELRNNKHEIAEIGKEEYMNKKLVKMTDEALLVKLVDMLYNISDQPKEAAIKRMVNNVEYLLENRENIPCKYKVLIEEIKKSGRVDDLQCDCSKNVDNPTEDEKHKRNEIERLILESSRWKNFNSDEG